MSQPVDMTAKVHIILEIDRPGPGMQQLADDVKVVGVRIAEVNQIQNTYRTTTTSTTASVRMLLLNMRMFSFGVRTLRREFGDTNPVLEQFSSGLITIAAIGTSLVSGVDLIKHSVARLAPIVAGLNFGLGALAGTAKIAIGVLGLTAGGVGAVLLTLAAIPIASWAMDAASGISALRQEAKSLEVDLKMLETQLKALSAEQDKFNLGTSATQLRLRELKRALDLAGGSNAALEAQIAATTAELENMAIASGYAKLEQSALNVVQTETKILQDELLRQASARRQARTGPGGMIGAETIAEAMRLQGITSGRPSRAFVERAAAGREQRAAGLGGGAQSIIINFPGAVFNTAEDIVGSLQAGAEAAARILYNQYGVPGAQR